MTSSPARKRLRSAGVALTLTALSASMLTGCAAGEPDAVAICMDPVTEERLDDDYCDDDGGSVAAGYVWFYMLGSSSHPVPGVGHRVTKTHGSTSLSSLGKNLSVARGGMPAAGATSATSAVKSTVKSGGFGKVSGGSRGGFSSS